MAGASVTNDFRHVLIPSQEIPDVLLRRGSRATVPDMPSSRADADTGHVADDKIPPLAQRLILVTTALLLVAAAAGFMLIRQANLQRDAFAQSAKVQLGTERLRSSLLGAERLVQAAMVGGQQPAQAVASLRTQVFDQLDVLRESVKADARQAHWLDSLRTLAGERFELLPVSMLTADGNLNPFSADPQARRRAVASQRIETLLQALQAAQESERAVRELALFNTTRTSGGLTLAMAVLILLLQGLGARAVATEVRRSRLAESQARESAASLKSLNLELERRVAERTQALNERSEALGRTHERLSTVSRAMLQVVEGERRALARELHDDLGQQMAALKMNLQLIQRYPQDRPERIEDSVQVVEHCIGQLRARAISLRPPMLDELGLAEALRAHAQRQARRSGMVVVIDLVTDFDAALDEWTSAVYRIVQEALRNVETHASATRIWLSLRPEGAEVVLRLRDDGAGLSLTVDMAHAGMGLLTMRERTELLRGHFSLVRAEPHGLEVVCRWALHDVLQRSPAEAVAAGD